MRSRLGFFAAALCHRCVQRLIQMSTPIKFLKSVQKRGGLVHWNVLDRLNL